MLLAFINVKAMLFVFVFQLDMYVDANLATRKRDQHVPKAMVSITH